MAAPCTASHYDAVAEARTQSRRTPLQKFHNEAKRALLQTYAQGAPRLLDLACGRGGDIHKWLAAQVGCVTGLDISASSVAEARTRFASTRSPAGYRFEHADLASGVWTDNTRYDVVTCMFALHYFFASEQTAQTIMQTVALNLNPGGHFIGIVPDAAMVNECIKYGPFDNGVMQVAAHWPGKPQCFGSAYTCNIQSTVTEKSEVCEYLVYGSVLESLAKQHGMRAVPISHPMFKASAGGLLHPLVPPYAGAMGECSRVFSAFVIKKL